jgi:ribonuclease J
VKLTIHRGTNQIGGCITEIESGGYRVFIDFGEQLPGTASKDLPSIDGLTYGDVSKNALFITHYHGDHIGEIHEIVVDVQIFVGTTALKIYKCLTNKLSHIPNTNDSEKYKRIIERIDTIKTFEALRQIKIGEIVVTPLFTDHSAFDAYMFIVEAEGKRMLHTGDFRGHGFRSKRLIPMLKRYATNIDYVISEGSNIQRPNATIQTEQALQKDFESQFRENKYNFVLVSSTNIDRIFALYHASRNAQRCFVCDGYQAEILKIVSENHKQYTSFYDIDYVRKTPAGRFLELKRRGRNPYSFNGKLKPYLDKNGFCMLIRSNDAFKLLLTEYAKSDATKIYYSMWNGYLDRGKATFNESLYDFLAPYRFEYKHTSGHADIETLKMVFDTVNPKSGIIPIHTESPEKFQALFHGQTVILLHDGDVLDC